MHKLVHNAATGEITEVALSEQELLQVQKDKEQAAAEKLLVEQSAEAKAAVEAKLAALGLDADDLKALRLQNNL